MTNPETLGFQTEAKQLLHLMTHSLYSNKEIFLRELISNASDAIDKLRFEAMDAQDLYEGDTELGIRIEVDEENNTLTVTDNGIGMSRQEAVEHLGTIAKSGTAQFLQSLTGDQKKDSHLIGQFGVGFYSAFIVAKKVVVETRRAGLAANEGVRWCCEGEAEYSVETIEKPQRGTVITLHLKDDETEFTNSWRLRSIIKKYSDHIAVPILMEKQPAPGEKESEEKEKTEKKPEWETVNEAKALWTRPRNEVSEEDYKSFYKHISHDFTDPLTWSHNRVEGKLEYTSLLYIPRMAPFDLFRREAPRGLKLHVQRTFIMDDAEQFLPLYLRFVKGVIDCSDLPLNVSRELLQNSPAVESIRAALTKRVLDMLENLAKTNAPDYAIFWNALGDVLKEGLGEDYANREKVASLLRFASTQNDAPEQIHSLQDYIARMKEGQDSIYYLVAESHSAAVNSPYLEIFRKHGVEVLLLSDKVDEWAMSHLSEFSGKKLQDVARGELELAKITGEDKEEEQSADAKAEETDAVITRIKNLLGEKVEDVRATGRLTESPACVVLNDQDMGVQMRKIMEAAGQKLPENKPILEVNTSHPLVVRLQQQEDDEKAGDLANLLLDQAVLSAGDQLENPSAFIKRLNKLLLEMEA